MKRKLLKTLQVLFWPNSAPLQSLEKPLQILWCSEQCSELWQQRVSSDLVLLRRTGTCLLSGNNQTCLSTQLHCKNLSIYQKLPRLPTVTALSRQSQLIAETATEFHSFNECQVKPFLSKPRLDFDWNEWTLMFCMISNESRWHWQLRQEFWVLLNQELKAKLSDMCKCKAARKPSNKPSRCAALTPLKWGWCIQHSSSLPRSPLPTAVGQSPGRITRR